MTLYNQIHHLYKINKRHDWSIEGRPYLFSSPLPRLSAKTQWLPHFLFLNFSHLPRVSTSQLQEPIIPSTHTTLVEQ